MNFFKSTLSSPPNWWHPHLFMIFLLGFTSGLPFLLTLSTLNFWLAESGVSKTTIGMFMLVSLPYSLKFLWAPIFDQLRIPYLTNRLGKRRSWALVLQVCLMIALFALGGASPQDNILYTAMAATAVAFFSASQDIIIDAYRIETLALHQRGFAAALETIGFRFGMIASGAGALYIASLSSWQIAYYVMAALVGVGLVTVLFMPETTNDKVVSLTRQLKSRSWFERMYITATLPWRQFNHKNNIVYLLLFILCFKMADSVMNAMSAPFLCDLGFSKIEFANVSKIFGITLMVFGGLLGGVMIHKFGSVQSLIMCAVLQGLSCLMFTIQALVGYDCYVLMITVGVESFCSGLTSTLLIAYISEFCCQPHTASHFTLLYSFGSLCRVLASSMAGWLADHIGWSVLFLMMAVITVPTIALILRLERPEGVKEQNNRLSRIA